MIKVIWLSNVRFSTSKLKQTGSWLQPLAMKLQESKEVEVINICRGKIKTMQIENVNNIKQYVLPIQKDKYYGQIPCKETTRKVISIIDDEKPNLVHIWGTESIWAYMHYIQKISAKTLIDIQGLLAPYTAYYYGGLTNKEILQSIHFKELIMPQRSLFWKKLIFKRRGELETKFLKSFNFISVQSNWVKQYINYIVPDAKIFPTGIMLREKFYDAKPWHYNNNIDHPIIFSMCTAAVSYKGIHVLIKTMALLKQTFPNIVLNLAGSINVGNRLLDGYSIFINKLINELNLQNNIHYLGSIDEDEIIKRLQECNVCVIPSFIETYCLAFAEAMIIGTPTVTSYTGAMPELAEHKKETLFYNSIDHYTAATYISELITNKELANFISHNARNKRLKNNNPERVLENQLNIYKSIIND